ncbi:PREDICTED: type II inositol 1,4,5-trisphosphate 5-phosphatase-like [Galeopterus variegatus]|uniref:Type II inositol 1,4,5-trisphosphate 5-phosphatase-like n=1 Tax=Galeopterus variegatus TaxID=482537 RepID=A0ABM0QH30_GALVR|nr:PREDICTED: type II inositol 1,4,5-trisphosphate 5-phosphatase-like [Galeopterus variegatus]
MAITGDDVSLDQIVPISRDFTLEEVSPDGELYILGSDVTVRLDTEELSLMFQLPFGSHTRMFLQEVARAYPGFDPATRDPQFLWLSRYRSAELVLESQMPRGWSWAPGTWPGCTTISEGMYPSRKGAVGIGGGPPQGWTPSCVGAGRWSRLPFDWRRWLAGAGPPGGGARGAAGDEELEEAGREMSAATGSRERDSAGLAGGGKLGWGSGPGAAAAGPVLGWAGSAV